MITVANVKDLGSPDTWEPWCVYVGRANPRKGLKASPLANPYRLSEQQAIGYGVRLCTREEILGLYRRYVLGSRDDAAVRDELGRILALYRTRGRLTLVCWCVTWDGTGEAPGRCHAEVIREYLASAAERGETDGR